jgi:DNA invertase Pin-like site-specific DNA recombinase
MKDTIEYLRVSTREQGRSGLGLAAQRNDIEAFGAREGFRVKSFEVAICNIKSWSRPASQVPACHTRSLRRDRGRHHPE